MGVLWNWTVGDLGSIKFWTGAHGIGLSGSVVGGSFLWSTSLKWVAEFPITWNTNGITHVSYTNSSLILVYPLYHINHLYLCSQTVQKSVSTNSGFICSTAFIGSLINNIKNHPEPSWRLLQMRTAFNFYSDNSHLCVSTLRHNLTFQHHVE